MRTGQQHHLDAITFDPLFDLASTRLSSVADRHGRGIQLATAFPTLLPRYGDLLWHRVQRTSHWRPRLRRPARRPIGAGWNDRAWRSRTLFRSARPTDGRGKPRLWRSDPSRTLHNGGRPWNRLDPATMPTPRRKNRYQYSHFWSKGKIAHTRVNAFLANVYFVWTFDQYERGIVGPGTKPATRSAHLLLRGSHCFPSSGAEPAILYT